MKSFFRFVFGTLTSLAFTIVLLLTTILFQIFNPQFLISALDKPEVYQETQRAVRIMLKNSLEAGFEKEGLDIEMLSVGERKVFNEKIKEITDVATADKIQDFTENNIEKILFYINGQSEKLTLYIPYEKWELPIEADDQETLGLFTENTDVEKLIELGEFPLTAEQIKKLHNLRAPIYQIWQISIAVFVVLLIIRFFLGKKSVKASSLGKLLIMLGVSTLVISALSKLAGDKMLSNVARYKDQVQILLGSMAAPIVVEIIKLWLIVGSGLVILGIIIIFLGNKLKKDKAPKDSKKKSASLASQEGPSQKFPFPGQAPWRSMTKTENSSQPPSELDPKKVAKGNKSQEKSTEQKVSPTTPKPLAPQPQKE